MLSGMVSYLVFNSYDALIFDKLFIFLQEALDEFRGSGVWGDCVQPIIRIRIKIKRLIMV